MIRDVLLTLLSLAGSGLTNPVSAQLERPVHRFADEVSPRFDTVNNVSYGQAIDLTRTS
ncbi:hypothetical protein [Spirosoma sp.]|uniref:hypothetical protein n=1 Tax=Spirosoma sp. TaxID=1899569 RepID=UPI0026263507|nr:hypothetical protein [Spirosoma sp.]MCX6218732.1 hypothetical protein [Spirosoma sp.]